MSNARGGIRQRRLMAALLALGLAADRGSAGGCGQGRPGALGRAHRLQQQPHRARRHAALGRQAARGHERRQHPLRDLRARQDDPGDRGVRRRQLRQDRRRLLVDGLRAGQDPRRAAVRRGAVRHEPVGVLRLDVQRRRRRAAEGGVRPAQRRADLLRRRQPGDRRLVPQGAHLARRRQGAEDPLRRPRRQGDAEGRRQRHRASRRRDLPGAGEGRDRRHRVLHPHRRRAVRLLQGR